MHLEVSTRHDGRRARLARQGRDFAKHMPGAQTRDVARRLRKVRRFDVRFALEQQKEGVAVSTFLDHRRPGRERDDLGDVIQPGAAVGVEQVEQVRIRHPSESIVESAPPRDEMRESVPVESRTGPASSSVRDTGLTRI